MMTEKQATKIRSIFCNKIPQEELYTPLTDELAILTDIAIKKQIPKKANSLRGTHLGKGKGGHCPICNCGVNSVRHKYCPNCGQALDWSDTE